MAPAQEKTTTPVVRDATTIAESDPNAVKIDPTAPAGSENSLGKESVRDVRPATGDDIVEAIDEATPVTPDPPSK